MEKLSHESVPGATKIVDRCFRKTGLHKPKEYLETEYWGSFPGSPSWQHWTTGVGRVFFPTECRMSGRPDSFSEPPVPRSVSGTKPALRKVDFTCSKTGSQRMRLSVQLVWSRKMLNRSFMPLATGRLQGKTSSSISTFRSLHQGHRHRRQNCCDLTLPSALTVSFLVPAGLMHTALGTEDDKGRKGTRHAADPARWGKSRKRWRRLNFYGRSYILTLEYTVSIGPDLSILLVHT